MKYRFILGVGRGGTTLLGRMMAYSTSRLRFVVEPLPRLRTLPENRYVEPWSVLPSADDLDHAEKVLASHTHDAQVIRDPLRDETVERDDPQAEILLIKEVHGLLAFPVLSRRFDSKTVVITRDVERILDSYFSGHRPEQRTYLVDEYRFLRDHHRRLSPLPGGEILETAWTRSPAGVRSILRRPRSLTSELSRQAATTAFVLQTLVAWADSDPRVIRIRFEDLCRDPVGECERLFQFLDLERDATSVQQIRETTRGSGTGYYDTAKDSLAILNQPFQHMTPRRRKRVRRMLGVRGD